MLELQEARTSEASGKGAGIATAVLTHSYLGNKQCVLTQQQSASCHECLRHNPSLAARPALNVPVAPHVVARQGQNALHKVAARSKAVCE